MLILRVLILFTDTFSLLCVAATLKQWKNLPMVGKRIRNWSEKSHAEKVYAIIQRWLRSTRQNANRAKRKLTYKDEQGTKRTKVNKREDVLHENVNEASENVNGVSENVNNSSDDVTNE